jgi:putative intracellular protease/amidase
VLQERVAAFFATGRPVGAICHGVLVLARSLDPAHDFERGPLSLTHRDSLGDSSPAFVVEDGHYVSARWPGDAYTFARCFAAKLMTSPLACGSLCGK